MRNQNLGTLFYTYTEPFLWQLGNSTCRTVTSGDSLWPLRILFELNYQLTVVYMDIIKWAKKLPWMYVQGSTWWRPQPTKKNQSLPKLHWVVITTYWFTTRHEAGYVETWLQFFSNILQKLPVKLDLSASLERIFAILTMIWKVWVGAKS
jgi:hypothetical protein